MFRFVTSVFLLMAVSVFGMQGQQVRRYSPDGMPRRTVFHTARDRSNCIFVVSKTGREHLNVYERRGEDTLLLASYPVCVGMNRGQKTRKGDYTTPESFPGKPFRITQIQDSSKWYHDFGDGRGRILAYGHWFMRLSTPGFTGIGIHGSTNNRESIMNGRGSEGCIRMLDEDIIHLHDNYADVGIPVIVLPEDMSPLPFEVRAMAAEGVFPNPREDAQYIGW